MCIKDRKDEFPRPMIKFIRDLNRSDLVGAEIGVLAGVNSHSILQTLSIKKLYLIDPYLTYKEYLDITSPGFHVLKKRAEARLREFKDKIVWVNRKSADAAIYVPDDLDFIYIDGNHSYKYCLEDIKNYWNKVKKGGIIGGHDYFNQGEAKEVKKAVDEFAEENKLKLYSEFGDGIYCDWWIVKC